MQEPERVARIPRKSAAATAIAIEIALQLTVGALLILASMEVSHD
jgi:hypothetical protein